MTRSFALLNLSFACVLGASADCLAQHAPASEEITMAFTGDSIITRRLSVYEEPQFTALIDLLRSADMAFTNLEMLFHDYEAYPMAESGGTWMRGDPGLADELAWAGIDMVARANNHTGDYGTLGMQLTTQYVAEAGIVQAGVGSSLAEAREAKFLETATARIALVSVASSFANHMRAERSRDDIPPRPGLNPLRYQTVYVMPENDFERLRTTGESLDQFTDQDGQPQGIDEEKPGEMEVFGRNFAIGDRPYVRMDVNTNDVSEITAVVNNASRIADFTIVTIHAHEHAGRRQLTPDFLHVFARAMIDAGADVFVGHGPHVLRGIEIYRGRPIFYSLGNFIFQNETLLRLPYDNYAAYDLGDNAHVADFNDERYEKDTKGFPALRENWESIVALPTFRDGKLSRLALYPITLGFGHPPHLRGRPLFADRKLSEKIINDLRELSQPYGTGIDFRGGIGIVDLADAD